MENNKIDISRETAIIEMSADRIATLAELLQRQCYDEMRDGEALRSISETIANSICKHIECLRAAAERVELAA